MRFQIRAAGMLSCAAEKEVELLPMPIARAVRCLGVLATSAVLTSPALAQEVGISELVDAWLAAPHGDYHSHAFTYWNEAGEVPVECAACHSEPGFIDYLGADGSATLAVDAPAPVNAPIGCAACHTSAAHALESVPFPSGVTVTGLGASAVCNVCHQGRASGDAVDAAIEGRDEDAVGPGLSFMNVHYAIAAAVMRGSEVRGGYQYPDRSYAGPFAHVPSASTCVSCHDPHSTAVETEGCFSCHRGVDDVREIRMRHADFDGDGGASAGIHAEIIGLHELLDHAIRTYAAEVIGEPVGYAPGRFPYFFNDLDADGLVGEEEAAMANRYASWTPRLLKAAYNYQFVAKDPGAYTHNPVYALQLLHDSIEDLSEQIGFDMSPLRRP